MPYTRTLKASLCPLFILPALLAGYLLFPSAASADITSGLVGWWKLDEGSGLTTVDSSVSGNGGTLSGSTLPEWIEGRIGSNALNLTGGGYVNVGASAYNLGIRRSATFCAWVNLPSFNPNGQFILSDYNSTTGGFGFYIRSSILTNYVYPGNYRINTDYTFSISTWYHVCTTMDGTSLRTYVNGEPQGNPIPILGDIGDSTNTLKIGRRGDLSYALYGAIDEVRIYDRALSDSDVATLYAYDGTNNQAPTASAGNDQTLNHPSLQATLSGSSNDDGFPEGASVTTTWSKISGPGTVMFGNENELSTTATFSEAGTYVLRLTADDTDLQATDDITITVPSSDNVPPVISGGLPSGLQAAGTTAVTLHVATDTDATCKYGTTPNTAYDSVANTFTITEGTLHTQTISGLANGTSRKYYVRCTDELSNKNTSDYTISFAIDIPSVSAPDFTIVVLPDIQRMTYAADPPERLGYWASIYNWIVDNKATQNIQAVVSVGDLTNDNQPTSWYYVTTGTDLIEGTGIPFVPAPGNHDFGVSTRTYTSYDLYFGPGHFASFPWYGDSSYPEGSNANHYSRITVGSRKILILSLEFYPRPEAVDWAKEVISSNPDYEIVITTHGYLNEDGSRIVDDDLYGPNYYSLDPADHNGEDLWDNLVNLYPNVRAVLSGHIVAQPYASYSLATGDAENYVHQIRQDYQSDGEGGSGIIGLLTFHSDSTVDLSYYGTDEDLGMDYDSRFPTRTLDWPAIAAASSDTPSTATPAPASGSRTRVQRQAYMSQIYADNGLPCPGKICGQTTFSQSQMQETIASLQKKLIPLLAQLLELYQKQLKGI